MGQTPTRLFVGWREGGGRGGGRGRDEIGTHGFSFTAAAGKGQIHAGDLSMKYIFRNTRNTFLKIREIQALCTIANLHTRLFIFSSWGQRSDPWWRFVHEPCLHIYYALCKLLTTMQGPNKRRKFHISKLWGLLGFSCLAAVINPSNHTLQNALPCQC